MLLKTGLPTLGRPRWRGRRLACSRRWVRGCLRGHPSANSGSEAVDGSVDVGGVSPSRLSPFSPVIFSGEQAGYPDGPTTLSFFQWSRQAVPLWHGSARQGGSHQAWHCPSGVSALNRGGGVAKPLDALWWASAQ